MTGATALRLHISGHATPPTGVNDLTVGAFDGPTLPALQLLVTYEVSAKH